MQEKAAIRATLQGEERLRHNFRSGGICAAAMHLDLRNCSDAAASLCIETGTGSPSRGMLHAHLLDITIGTVCLLKGQLKITFGTCPFAPVRQNLFALK